MPFLQSVPAKFNSTEREKLNVKIRKSAKALSLGSRPKKDVGNPFLKEGGPHWIKNFDDGYTYTIYLEGKPVTTVTNDLREALKEIGRGARIERGNPNPKDCKTLRFVITNRRRKLSS